MAAKFRRFKIHIDYKGLGPDGFSWPRYKEFTEAFVAALSGMPDGPSADQVIPLEVKETQSQLLAFKIPDHCLDAVCRIAQPNETWKEKEREKAKPLHKWIRDRDARCEIIVAKRPPLKIVVPTEEPPPCCDSYDTVDGIVITVGGRERHVHLELPDGLIRVFAGGPGIVEGMAQFLYHRVLVSAKMTWDESGADIREAEILRIIEDLGHMDDFPTKKKNPKSQYEAIQRMRALLSDSLADFDVEEFVKGIRDG